MGLSFSSPYHNPLFCQREILKPIPAQTAIVLPLIAHLAAAHNAVLENWKRKFALDLSWQSGYRWTLRKR